MYFLWVAGNINVHLYKLHMYIDQIVGGINLGGGNTIAPHTSNKLQMKNYK